MHLYQGLPYVISHKGLCIFQGTPEPYWQLFSHAREMGSSSHSGLHPRRIVSRSLQGLAPWSSKENNSPRHVREHRNDTHSEALAYTTIEGWLVQREDLVELSASYLSRKDKAQHISSELGQKLPSFSRSCWCWCYYCCEAGRPVVVVDELLGKQVLYELPCVGWRLDAHPSFLQKAFFWHERTQHESLPPSS